MIAPVRETSTGKENTREIFQEHTWSGSRIDVVDIPEIASLNFISESVLAAPFIAEKVVQAKKSGYDGVLVSCFLEPGVQVAKELVSIPVLGPMHAALCLANLLGRRIGLVGIGPRDAVPGHSVTPLIRSAGLDMHVVSVRQIPFENYHMSSAGKSEFQVTQDAMTHEVRESIRLNQTDVIVLCCTGLSGFASELMGQVNIPVIDSAIAGLKMCEAMIDMKSGSKAQQSDPGLSKNPLARTRLRLIFPTENHSRDIPHDVLRKIPSEDADVDVCCAQEGEVKSTVQGARIARAILNLILQSEKDGFDAAVVGTFDSSIISAGRELVKIPVVGLLETSMLLASAFYHKTGLLSDMTGSEVALHDSLRWWNLSSIPHVIESIELPQRLLSRNPKKLKQRFMKRIQKLRDSGVDVVLPCSLQISSILETWKDEVNISVMNPVKISLRIAEILCSMGLSHSKLAYPTPVIPGFTLERLRRTGQLSDLELLPYREHRVP